MKVHRKAILVCGMLLSAFISQAQSKIIAQISNARNDRGVCQVCLFNNAVAFAGESGTPLRCLQVALKSRAAEAVFENVPAGTYAVAVFHDANNNSKMDKNFLGVPKEGYGASRNNLPFAAAPDFNENKFTLPNHATTTLRIRLRNL